MRLIDAKHMVQEEQLLLREKSELGNKPYAILSHTWGRYTESSETQDGTWDPDDAEILFADINDQTTRHRKEYAWRKILMACKAAQDDHIDYLWVDTCCFNKDSSAELDESINAMFGWYKESKVCLVYLADLEVDRVQQKEDLKHCRWFKRGWTLQELVAPMNVDFYNQDWKKIGSNRKTIGSVSEADDTKTKEADDYFELGDILSAITKIDDRAFKKMACSSFTVAERMKWAADRKTRRPEDRAYSLLGLFGVHMSLIYGIGGEAAFRRLQVEIIQNTTDMTVFAWNSEESDGASPDSIKFCSMLADSPDQFSNSPSMTSMELEGHFSITNKGVSLDASTLRIVPNAMHESDVPLVLMIGWSDHPKLKEYILCYGVYLQKIGSGNYVRCVKDKLAQFEENRKKYELQPVPRHQCYITISVPDAESVFKKSRRKAIAVLKEFKPSKSAELADPSLDWTIKVLNCVPERNWDYRNGLFFRVGYGHRDVVRAVSVDLSLLGLSFKFAVLLHGDGDTLKAYIMDESNANWPDVKPIFGPSQRFDSAKWDDLMIDLSHQSEYLDVVAQGRYFRVSASLFTEHNDDKKKWNLRLDVAPDAYYQIEILKGRVKDLEGEVLGIKRRLGDDDECDASKSNGYSPEKRAKSC